MIGILLFLLTIGLFFLFAGMWLKKQAVKDEENETFEHFERPNMEPLTREQKEYLELKTITNAMVKKYLDMRERDEIPQCWTKKHYENTKYIWEDLFYNHLEDLKEQHNAQR